MDKGWMKPEWHHNIAGNVISQYQTSKQHISFYLPLFLIKSSRKENYQNNVIVAFIFQCIESTVQCIAGATLNPWEDLTEDKKSDSVRAIVMQVYPFLRS